MCAKQVQMHCTTMSQESHRQGSIFTLSISEYGNHKREDHSHYFKREYRTLHQAKDDICHNVWSNIFWAPKVGKRNFAFCSTIAFDIDGGWSLTDAHAWCRERGYNHLIGTTKSHQKTKGDKPPCDRFRLLIPLDRFILGQGKYNPSEEYAMLMDRVRAELPPIDDTSDQARRYRPCTEIAVVYEQGGRLSVDSYLPELKGMTPVERSKFFVRRYDQRQAEIEQRKSLVTDGQAYIPPWVFELLGSGLKVIAERNSELNRFAYYASKRWGWSHDEIVEVLEASAVSKTCDRNRIVKETEYGTQVPDADAQAISKTFHKLKPEAKVKCILGKAGKHYERLLKRIDRATWCYYPEVRNLLDYGEFSPESIDQTLKTLGYIGARDFGHSAGEMKQHVLGKKRLMNFYNNDKQLIGGIIDGAAAKGKEQREQVLKWYEEKGVQP